MRLIPATAARFRRPLDALSLPRVEAFLLTLFPPWLVQRDDVTVLPVLAGAASGQEPCRTVDFGSEVVSPCHHRPHRDVPRVVVHPPSPGAPWSLAELPWLQLRPPHAISRR